MLLEPAEAADRGPSHGTVLAMDRARAAGAAQPLGRTDLEPGPSHTPVRSKQSLATWGAHPTLGTRTAKPGSSPPAVHPETHQRTPIHDTPMHVTCNGPGSWRLHAILPSFPPPKPYLVLRDTLCSCEAYGI